MNNDYDAASNCLAAANREQAHSATVAAAPEKARLVATIVPQHGLSTHVRSEMWALFAQYYEGVTVAAFEADLAEKCDVILLHDRATGALGGFSTIVLSQHRVQGQHVEVLFSGDTIVAAAYWGDRSLHRSLAGYLARRKLRRPWVPLYWLLLTKGYKTYLLLTRNFPNHYPTHRRSTPSKYTQLLDTICSARYGQYWNPAEGIVRFNQQHGQLKQDVAPLPPHSQSEPDIAYFAQANPNHHAGDELVCIGEASLWMLFRFAWRTPWRIRMSKHRASTAGF